MTYHIFVSGRVQGVGYRRFAQKQAEALSLRGWTRNLMDGRVELMVLGEVPALENFCERLKKGPLFSQIREIVVKVFEDSEGKMDLDLSGFEIRSDAEIQR